MTYTAAACLQRLVSDFAQRQPAWAECVLYETKLDERWDLTLVSRRVYGTSDDYLTIAAAAGLDSLEFDPLPDGITLVLPTKRQLDAIKAQCGFNLNQWERAPEQAADPLRTR